MEMNTIFPVLLAFLSGALLLPLRPAELNAAEVLPQAPAEEYKTSVQTQTGPLPASSTSKVRKPAKTRHSSQLSKQAPAKSALPAGEPNDPPPVFQVSSDPRDQVQFLVHDGIVTIQGTVGTRELARKVIRKYARMPGVRSVRNRLTVRTNNDVEIARRVREVFSRDPETRAGGIAVTVSDGVVFLSGAVSSAQEKEHAEKVAEVLQGVRRVNNGLRLPGQIRQPVRLPPRARTYRRK